MKILILICSFIRNTMDETDAFIMIINRSYRIRELFSFFLHKTTPRSYESFPILIEWYKRILGAVEFLVNLIPPPSLLAASANNANC